MTEKIALKEMIADYKNRGEREEMEETVDGNKMALHNKKIKITWFMYLILSYSLWIPIWITTIFIRKSLLMDIANWGPFYHALLIVLISIYRTKKKVV